MDIWRLLGIVFFILMNAVFVLVEFAVVRARRTRIEELSQDEKNIFAKISLEIINNINSYLASIQLGITAASIGLGWIAQPYFSSVINRIVPDISIFTLKISSYSISLAVSFFIVTFIHIVLGEQVPKYLAISYAEKITLLFSLPLKIFYKITYYPMLFINSISEFFVRLIGSSDKKDETYHSDEEIRLILSKSEEMGKISLQRLMMFEHLFDFGKTIAKEIMVPKDKIIYLKKNINLYEFLDTVKKYSFSRYPVVDEKGCFCGYVHVKDFVINQMLLSDKSDFDINSYIRSLNRVREKDYIESVLRKMQENHQPLLLVENEKGDVTGLITVEDVVEELTGEIRDEFERKSLLRLDEIFSVEGSIANLKSVDRFSAIVEMIDKLYTSETAEIRNEVINRVIKREKALSTAIGHQIAIPHARIEGLKKPVLTAGISKNGIYFASPDKKPVKLIFLILTPYSDPSSQLNILSKISRLVMNVTLRKKLLGAENCIKIKEIFTVFEDSIPSG